MPAFHGNPGLSGHSSSRCEYVTVVSTLLFILLADRRKPIDAGLAGSMGRAGSPHDMLRLTSRGQRRVSAHHAVSSRKLLPRPLSPVRRFTRGANSISISWAGPVFFSRRYSSIGSLSLGRRVHLRFNLGRSYYSPTYRVVAERRLSHTRRRRVSAAPSITP